MTDPLALPTFSTGPEHPKKRDPEFRMRTEPVRTLGKDLASHSDDLTAMSKKTQGIDLPSLTFGVIGYGLANAHGGVRDSAADALAKGKDVLESWRTALGAAADYTELADGASKTGGGKPPPSVGGNMPKFGGGKMPDTKGLDLPDNKLPDHKLPDDKWPDDKLPDDKWPDDKLPDDKWPDDKWPDDKLPDDKLPDDKWPDDKLPDDKWPDDKLPDDKLPDPKLPDGKLPDSGLPDTSELDKKLTNPIESKLSGYDPNLSGQDLTGRTLPQPNTNLPTTSLPDPRSGSGTGIGSGGGAGGGAGGGLGTAGAGVRGLAGGGMPMYPMVPGMGGGGMGEQDKDKDGSGLLKGDPEDWEDDQDIAPPVLGKE
ncbi:hypothetical protein [Nonomuraea dietziae]|uniref:hypothetical protein n=1 Tax=Nonomuraea dietziae TaxID=65515 RepID=UPI0034139B23